MSSPCHCLTESPVYSLVLSIPHWEVPIFFSWACPVCRVVGATGPWLLLFQDKKPLPVGLSPGAQEVLRGQCQVTTLRRSVVPVSPVPSQGWQ